MSTPASSLHDYPKDENGFVIVQEDKPMHEQLVDQEMRAPLIRVLRKELASFFEANKDSELAQEIQTNDRTAWRFLKARNFVREKTSIMVKEAVELRREMKLDTILTRPPHKGLEWKEKSMHGWHYWDNYGRPIFIKHVGLQDLSKLQQIGSVADRLHYTLFYNEYFNKVLIPEANARIGHKTTIDQICTIVNMQDFGMHSVKKFNYDWVRELARINSLIYPENLGNCFLINCPRVFSMVWSVVKPWLDERTRTKIQIFHDDGAKVIAQYVDLKRLPKTIGGECECGEKGCCYGAQNAAFVEKLRSLEEQAGKDAAAEEEEAAFLPTFHDAEEEERDLEQMTKAFEEGVVVEPLVSPSQQ